MKLIITTGRAIDRVPATQSPFTLSDPVTMTFNPKIISLVGYPKIISCIKF